MTTAKSKTYTQVILEDILLVINKKMKGKWLQLKSKRGGEPTLSLSWKIFFGFPQREKEKLAKSSVVCK